MLALSVVAGIVCAGLMVWLAMALRAERWIYSMSLLALPGFYVGFALWGHDTAAAWHEALLGVPYVVAGIVCTLWPGRVASMLVGLFWLTHGLIDLAHPGLVANAGVPAFYPAFCAAVDIAVGAYLVLVQPASQSGRSGRSSALA